MIKSTYILLLSLLLCVSCSITRQNGSLFTDNMEKLENFDVFNITKEDLVRNFGEPSLELEDGTWLYYNYTTKNISFMRKKINKESILLVNFDEKDNIISHSFKKRDNLKSVFDVRINDEKGDDSILDIMKGLEFNLGN